MKGMALGIICLLMGMENATAQGRVSVKLANLRNAEGVCRVCLYNSPEAFSGEGGTPVQCATVLAKAPNVIVFDGLSAGTYAVFVFHDVNNNNRMDKNFFGIPKEGYGASRNSLPFAAAPTFEANKFTVPDKSMVLLQIRLRNL